MAFVQKEWKGRLVEFAGRRILKNVATGESAIYDVERNEGAVSQEGDAFSPANMNDLEQRIADEFGSVNNNLGGFTPIIDAETGKITGYKTTVGADTVFPFNTIDQLIRDNSGNLITAPVWNCISGSVTKTPTSFSFPTGSAGGKIESELMDLTQYDTLSISAHYGGGASARRLSLEIQDAAGNAIYTWSGSNAANPTEWTSLSLNIDLTEISGMCKIVIWDWYGSYASTWTQILLS